MAAGGHRLTLQREHYENQDIHFTVACLRAKKAQLSLQDAYHQQMQPERNQLKPQDSKIHGIENSVVETHSADQTAPSSVTTDVGIAPHHDTTATVNKIELATTVDEEPSLIKEHMNQSAVRTDSPDDIITFTVNAELPDLKI